MSVTEEYEAVSPPFAEFMAMRILVQFKQDLAHQIERHRARREFEAALALQLALEALTSRIDAKPEPTTWGRGKIYGSEGARPAHRPVVAVQRARPKKRSKRR